MASKFKKIISSTLIVTLLCAFAIPAEFAVESFVAPKKAEASFSNCAVSFLTGEATSASGSAQAAPTAIPVLRLDEIQSGAIKTGESNQSFFKDCVEHGFATAIGRLLLAQMTQSIVSWINSGFSGSPSFVTDPQQFFTNIGDEVAGAFIYGSDFAFMCQPFQADIQGLLNYHYSNNFQHKAVCTLSSVITNANNFVAGVQAGGWKEWLNVTQNPYNNTYGSYLEASSQLKVNINNKTIIEGKKLDWGKGFLSYESCDDGTITWGGKASNNSGVTVSSGNLSNSADSGGEIAGGHGNCTIKTPGTTIASSLDGPLNGAATQLGVADDFDKIFNALGDQVFNQIIGGAKGLLGATANASNGNQQGSLDSFSKNPRSIADNHPEWQTNANAARNTAVNNINSTIDNINSDTDTSGGTDSSYVQNMALGTFATESSKRTTHAPDALTDGDRKNSSQTSGGTPHFDGAWTQVELNPWMETDLGKTKSIGRIVVYENPVASGVTAAQALIYRVQILDKNRNLVWQSDPQTEDFTNNKQINVPNKQGEFVRIQASGTGDLEIAELEVNPYVPAKITLKGAAVITVAKGGAYTDPGFTATDSNGTDVTSNVVPSGSVDTSTPGSYTIAYTITDANGSKSVATRQVIVTP